MGMGDWLMATGEVKKLYANNPIQVLVVGQAHKPMWNEVFLHNNKIARSPAHRHQTLLNGPNARPYIKAKTDTRWHWKPYGPEPGELFFTATEVAFAAPYKGKVLIEPSVKKSTHANKAWIEGRWQELVDATEDIDYVQCGPAGTVELRRVMLQRTDSFRLACAVLSVCRAFVGAEGGLMHAAAALNVPAVVLWSEFIDPSITGYANHRNIRHAGASCGMRVYCSGCRRSMLSISVAEVELNLREVLQ